MSHTIELTILGDAPVFWQTKDPLRMCRISQEEYEKLQFIVPRSTSHNKKAWKFFALVLGTVPVPLGKQTPRIVPGSVGFTLCLKKNYDKTGGVIQEELAKLSAKELHYKKKIARVQKKIQDIKHAENMADEIHS